MRNYQTFSLPDKPYLKPGDMPETTHLHSRFRGVTAYLWFTVLVATCGPLQFGFHLAELNAPQKVITCEEKAIRASGKLSLPQCIPMNPLQFGLVSSIFTLGGLIGALSAGPALSNYGRLFIMRTTSLFFVIGPVFEALGPNIGVLSLGRFLSGLGAGAAVVVVPIYISETAPIQQRGLFGAFNQVQINFGIFISQLLGYFLSYDSAWRIILICGGAIGAFQAFMLLFIIESPKHMALHGSPSTARRNLQRLRGRGVNIDDEVNTWSAGGAVASNSGEEEALLDTATGLEDQGAPGTKASTEGGSGVGIWEVARSPKTRSAVIAVVVVMASQQLCGINSIVMYSVSILGSLLPTTAALLTVLFAVVNLVMSILCSPLADVLGRKPCLLISIAGMGLNSIMLAFSMMFGLKVLSAIATLLFVASFAVGLGPVPFLLATELVGTEAVGATQSWALASSWIATFAVAQFFPIVNAAMGEGHVYFIFAGLAAGFFAFTVWWVPESKGKTNVDEIWGRS
ncbi:MAG: hypothetical protein M1814_005466 [Vezdaea aestivalis]|nr:MAG: hypothetical protein M1814_005466 [Vezdaea aestivalis]